MHAKPAAAQSDPDPAACAGAVGDGEEPDFRVVVYRFAVAREALPGPIVEEMRRAHGLRNRLVELELGYQQQVAAIWAEQRGLAAAQQRVEEAQEQLREAKQAIAAHRQQTGRQSAPAAAVAAVKQARAEYRAARQELKTAKNDLFPQARPLLAQARKERAAALKAAYRRAVDEGLYWASVNAVTAAHQTAVRQVSATRAAGRSAQLRFRRWDGAGTIAVQLQRARGVPRRSPQILGGTGGPWRNVLRISEAVQAGQGPYRGRKQASVAVVTVRIGSGEHARMVDIPVVMHRRLPAEADVTQVLVTRERIARHCRAWVSVAARVPASAVRGEGGVVALHMGWRALPGGGIRAGVVVGAPEEMRVTAEVRGWLRSVEPGTVEIIVPDDWVQGWQRLDEVRARRDREAARVHQWLAEQCRAHGWLHGALADTGPLSATPSMRQLAQLTHRVAGMRCPDGGDEGVWRTVLSRLGEWNRNDALLWEWHAHGRRRLVGRRLSAYRQIAAHLLAQAAVVAVEEWSLQSMVRGPAVEEQDLRQERISRRHRGLAAPGVLRQVLVAAAQSRGVQVARPPRVATDVHDQCGGVLDSEERARTVLARCGRCGDRVDQDLSAARCLADAARGRPDEM